MHLFTFTVPETDKLWFPFLSGLTERFHDRNNTSQSSDIYDRVSLVSSRIHCSSPISYAKENEKVTCDVMSWNKIYKINIEKSRISAVYHTILFCLMNIIDIGKYRAVTNLNGPPGGANWIFSLVNKGTIKEQTWFFKKGKLQIH